MLSTDKMMSFLCADTDERQQNVDLTTVNHPCKIKRCPLIVLLAQVCSELSCWCLDYKEQRGIHFYFSLRLICSFGFFLLLGLFLLFAASTPPPPVLCNPVSGSHPAFFLFPSHRLNYRHYHHQYSLKVFLGIDFKGDS